MVKELGSVSLFQNLDLSNTSTNEKCNLAIPWATSCQYQCIATFYQNTVTLQWNLFIFLVFVQRDVLVFQYLERGMTEFHKIWH